MTAIINNQKAEGDTNCVGTLLLFLQWQSCTIASKIFTKDKNPLKKGEQVSACDLCDWSARVGPSLSKVGSLARELKNKNIHIVCFQFCFSAPSHGVITFCTSVRPLGDFPTRHNRHIFALLPITTASTQAKCTTFVHLLVPFCQKKRICWLRWKVGAVSWKKKMIGDGYSTTRRLQKFAHPSAATRCWVAGVPTQAGRVYWRRVRPQDVKRCSWGNAASNWI